jgi:hypothetical protein
MFEQYVGWLGLHCFFELLGFMVHLHKDLEIMPLLISFRLSFFFALRPDFLISTELGLEALVISVALALTMLKTSLSSNPM